ncbi:MAG TPA: glycoside hydrolase family 15 protein [Kofleriaceae bacterium]
MLRATLVTLLCLGGIAGADVSPHASWTQLAFGNGRGAGAYDTSRRRMTSLREHVFQQTAAAQTRELLYDQYPGVRVNGANTWLVDQPIASAAYDAQRGIAVVTQSYNGVTVEQSYFQPFDVDAVATVVVYRVTNNGPAALTDSALFVLDNVHVGGGTDGTDSEHITWTNGVYEERGVAGLVEHRPSPAPLAHAATPQNPYTTVNGGGRLTNVDDSGVTNDAACGYEWDLGGMAVGETRTFSLVIAYAADGNRTTLDTALAPIPADPAAALAAARADWDAFFARAKTPDGLSTDELAVYRQQLAVLRMGQVRADGPGSGQIVASLPTGIWDIAWVRDQSYAVEALVDAGLAAEAKAALEFWWTTTTDNWVCCDAAGGPWVGAPYQVSVVRYMGDGTEESDSNDDGPNIEFDGFGLALGATADYVAATGDTQLVSDHADAIFAKTADVLVGLVEAQGAQQGLLRADSSIWETHWYNGGRKHFAFTSAAAVRGLRAAAQLAASIGRDGSTYSSAADALAASMASKLVDGSSMLRGNAEESSALDAAGVEAFNWGVLPPTGSVASATLDAYRAGLWNASGHGYHRNDDGGEYDLREWIMIDLRISQALRRSGREDRVAAADALVAWVTAQARANFDLIPENYDPTTGDYAGAIPMVGFGAGAYVETLWDRAAPAAAGDTAGPTPDAGPAPGGGSSGGCCSGAPGGASSALLSLVVLAFFARRRRRIA